MSQYESMEEAKTATYDVSNIEESALLTNDDEAFIYLDNGRNKEEYSANEIRKDADKIIDNNKLSYRCEEKIKDIQSFLENINYNGYYYKVNVRREEGKPIDVVVPLSECEHIDEDYHITDIQEKTDSGYKIKDDFLDYSSGEYIDDSEWYVALDTFVFPTRYLIKEKYCERVDKVDESYIKVSILGLFLPITIITSLISFLISTQFTSMITLIASCIIIFTGLFISNILKNKLKEEYYTYTESEDKLKKVSFPKV